MGLSSIKLETEIQYVRRGLYLQFHQDMQESKKRYERLAKAGWRNPLSDAEHIMQIYSEQTLPKKEDESVSDISDRSKKRSKPNNNKS